MDHGQGRLLRAPSGKPWVQNQKNCLELFSWKRDYPLTWNSITNICFCTLWMNQAFFKNSAQSLFIINQCLTSHKESEKSLDLFSGKSDNLPTQNSIINTRFCTLWMNHAFFQKSSSVTFHHLSMSSFMQRIREIVRAVLREK